MTALFYVALGLLIASSATVLIYQFIDDTFGGDR